MQDAIRQFFSERGWEPFPFQLEAWEAYLNGDSGLIHAPTGTGKTLAAWMGPVIEWMAEHPEPSAWPHPASPKDAPPLTVLWITPLRALASDTAASLRAPLEMLGIPWLVEGRTGDTKQSVRARQKERLPTGLITTPESLSLLLSYPATRERFATLRHIVVDEWHELIGSKRGVQTELCLARLRCLNPRVQTWGVSATLGNLEEAMAVLLGSGAGRGRMVHSAAAKDIRIETVLPPDIERFPWSGHIGIQLLPEVMTLIEGAGTTLLFTNTRSQAEIWHQSILDRDPPWADRVALHHGSLDRATREANEEGLKSGRIKVCVATSSLDLGVDFSPVDQVIQVGSPKGVGRLVQRAGRSGHRPGEPSLVRCVPSNVLEFVEYAAARDAVAAGRIENRTPFEKPLDVLVQHMVTIAAGDGFLPGELLAEVRGAHAYRGLSDDEWRWCLDFITIGGRALGAYPQYRKVSPDRDGRMTIRNDDIAKIHRLNIGTISSNATIRVKLANGGDIGHVEEYFIARLRPGNAFLFAGRALELVRIKDMTALVRPATKRTETTPRWGGGRMPLTSHLSGGVRARLDLARQGDYEGPEMRAVAPILRLQSRTSRIPSPGEFLIESIESREGHHVYLFPFAGRLVHEALAPVVAWRISQIAPRSITFTSNDYGFEMLSAKAFDFAEDEWRALLSTDALIEDLFECLNSSELAKRQFRDIAAVAGLVLQGYPGRGKTTRQVHVSAGLLFDVFMRFDPGNLLLEQARREVLEGQLEIARMRETLEAMADMEFVLVEPKRLSPLAFPLWAQRLREASVSSEDFAERVGRMVMELEAAVERGD
ncbi:MAG: ligase-associated DNA damage response DEXH box helicase [Sumerlaeia bacterium]